MTTLLTPDARISVPTREARYRRYEAAVLLLTVTRDQQLVAWCGIRVCWN
jgi:hypothetical protein